MKRRYIRDLVELDDEQTVSRNKRDKPCLVNSLGRQQPLQVLESLVSQWPTHDLRYNNPDMDDYFSADEELMVDLITGMETRVLRKDLSTGTLEYSVEFQNNLAEYERYNMVIEEHNELWKRQGCPTSVFDPVHGEVHKVIDQHVDPVVIASKNKPQPKSVYSNSKSPLAKARPTMKRTGYIRVIYQLTVYKASYTLGYVAYDSSDRVLYYNELTHKDLAYLVRRSVQELWGNPLETAKSGCYLEGISMLIQGKKIKICKKDNDKPAILASSAVLKERNPELLAATVQEKGLKTSESLLRWMVPLSLVIGILWWSLNCMGKAFNHIEGTNTTVCEPGIGMKWMIGMALIIGAFLVARWLTQYTQRRASQIAAEKRFI